MANTNSVSFSLTTISAQYLTAFEDSPEMLSNLTQLVDYQRVSYKSKSRADPMGQWEVSIGKQKRLRLTYSATNLVSSFKSPGTA
jgi:hypothetical protein